MTKHLGHEKSHAPHERDDTNVRNGTLTKTVISPTTGPVTIQVPRDRDGTFTPVIVPKRQRRLTGVEEIVLSLYARGLTTGEISAHFNQIYGAQVSKETVSRITDKVVEEMQTWQSRPLESVYSAIFIDAIVVKIRDGLKGLPDVVGNVWPLTSVQTCIIHLIRNTFKLTSKKDWEAVKRSVKPIYSAPTDDAARAALDDMTAVWGKK